MNLRPKTVTFLLTFLCWATLALAQDPVPCLDFEDLPAEGQYGPEFGQEAGDNIIVSNDLAVSIDSFFYSNGSGDLVRVSVFTDEGLLGDFGQMLFPSNASLTFRPTQNEALLSSLCFDFFYYGGSLNLGVNGQQRLLFENLNDLLELGNSELFPNVELSVDLAATDGFPIQGTLCVKGDLESLTIGGQEFALDNVCLETRSTNPCRWDNVSVKPVSCSEEGIIQLKVDFPSNWPVSDNGYYAMVEGKTFGPFRYVDTLIEVGPIPINDADLYEVILFQDNDAECRFRDFFRLPCVSRPCPITEIEAYIDECAISTDPLGSEIVVNFDHNSELALKFLLEIGGLVRDTFSTDQLPLRIRVPFVLPLEAPIMTTICLDVPGFSTPCCFELTLSRKECGPVNSCIAFEELEDGAVYGRDTASTAGRIIFIEDRVPVGIDSFVFADGDTFFGFTEVTSDLFGGGFRKASGQYLFVSNNNLNFYLGRTQKPINQVCFDFIEGGGSLNLGVNGYPVTVLSNFGEAADVDWPDGITATVTYDNTDNAQRQGTLCLSGDIQQLTVGGQELGLDNVCFSEKPEDICRISGLLAKPTPCGADGLFYVDLTFDQTGPSGEGFHVFRSNGLSLGTFSYEEDSVRVGPFNAYSRDLLYLIVQDKRFPNCADKILVDKPTDCMNDCGLGGIQVDILNCYDQLFYDLKIDLKYWPDSNADGRFRLLIEGRDFGTYAYSDLPLELDQVDIFTEATTFPVEICHLGPDDTATEQCCIRAVVDKKECLTACDLGELEIIEKQCDNSGGLYVALDFEHQNTSDYFVLARNGVPVGKYSYSELPIKAGPFYSSLTDRALKLSVYDVRSPHCQSSVLVDPFPCEPAPCELGEISIIDRYCDANGQAIIVIDFDHARTSGKFVLTLNNREVGTYAYRELPIKVGPFGPVDAAVLSLAATDAENPDCRTETRFETFPCEPLPCELGEIQVLEQICTDAGERYVKLDFRYQGTSDSFYLFQDDEVLRRYNYKHLPIKVKLNPTATGATRIQLRVVDHNSRSNICESSTTIEAFPCEPVPCELGDIRILEQVCTDAGERYVKLDFRYQGTSDSFYLFQDDEVLRRYHYKHLPIKVKLRPTAAGATRINLRVIDNNSRSNVCATSTTIEAFPCEPVPCELGEIRVIERLCTDNGERYVKIDFDYQGTSDSFYLFVNDKLIRRYNYKHLPIKVELPATTADATYRILAVDAGPRDACATDLHIEAFPCEPVPCELGEIKVIDKYCEDSGQRFVKLDFEYTGVSDSFYLYENNELVARYNYNHLPIKVKLDPASNTARTQLTVVDAKADGCAAEIIIEAFPCEPNDCHLGPIEIVDRSCEDGVLYLGLDFTYERVSESFVLLQNGNEIGTYRYDQLPIKVGPYYPPIEPGAIVLTAVDSEQRDCRTDLRLPALFCTDTCDLGPLKLEQTECDAAGTYFVTLNFDYPDANGRFRLIQNGDTLGQFAYAELPIRLGPFNEPKPNGLIVQVQDLADEQCEQKGFIAPLGCNTEPCVLYNLKTDDFECLEDGTYHMSLFYRSEGLREDQVLVATFSSGYQFRFLAGENPVRITDIPLPDTKQDVVTLCAANGPESCCISIDYDIPCRNSCGLNNLEVKASDCDAEGRFDLLVDLDYTNVSDGFTLFLNGRAYGNYKYEELPIRVGNLSGGADKVYQVTVRDFRNFDCKISTRIESPACVAPCALTGIKVRVGSCEDGLFKALIYPEMVDNREGAFLVFVGGELFGPYAYGTEEVAVGPFPATGQRYDVLVVDLDDPTCFAHAEIIAPENCEEPGDCVIRDLQIRVLECNPDGTYLVGIDFEARGADHEFFDVLDANGDVLGYYPIDELPLRVNLRLPADSTITLGVCINDRPNCCARAEVEVPDCSPEANCFLDRIKVSTTECDSNGQVFIVLESGLEASSNVAIEVIINDRIVDSIRFDASGTVRLGPIDPSIGRELFLLLGSLTSNDCFREIALRFPECADESDVWPGDANKDNIANYIDLINVGVAYGSRGLARAEQTTDWSNIPGSAWTQFFANGLNYKHADCNGDGIVDARDIGIILANYNKTNGEVQIPDTLPATDLDPPIRLELPPGGHMGSTDPRLNIPIILGEADRPVEDIYGLAFVIEFNPEHINPATIDVEILTSWMGVPGVNLASVDYTDAQNGRIEIAISRTDQNEVSGYGPIALLRGIKDDIAGIRTEIYLRHGRRTRIDLEEEGLGGGNFELFFTDPVTDPGLVDLRNSLSVYPNPSSDMVRVTTSYQVPIEEIQVLGTDGRTMTGVARNTEWISIKDLPEGIYVLRVKVGEHIIHKKVIRE